MSPSIYTLYKRNEGFQASYPQIFTRRLSIYRDDDDRAISQQLFHSTNYSLSLSNQQQQQQQQQYGRFSSLLPPNFRPLHTHQQLSSSHQTPFYPSLPPPLLPNQYDE
ncbi:unnamed protein product [Rotaria sordida]|uniref:Uncharacterized protein n=2 Tax=Rotaria sordida TaxID=392033 RepID=A0A814CRY8_9BILA|nr:unnamed protein product [Rotaria sordida]